MLLPLALAMLAATVPADTGRGAIRGSVQSDPTGLPVAAATVELKSAQGTRTAYADSVGEYQMRKVPPGRHTLRVRHMEHVPLEMEVLVPPGGEVVLDVLLKHRPVEIPAIVARPSASGGPGDTIAARPQELARLDQHVMEGGGADAVSGAGLAGARRPGDEPPDPDDALYVRGSAADLKLVLLDGVPVYAPFHTGGLLDTFEPGVLRSARMYLGGAPARYDGALSYVMELRTRGGNPERFASSGSVDLVSARGVAEGPLPGGSRFIASGRGIHTATLARLEGEPFPYNYLDGLARLDVPVDSASRLGLTVFSNREGVRVDTLSGLDNFARWGNAAASLRYAGVLLRSRGELTAAYSSFVSEFPRYRRVPMNFHGQTQRVRVALDLTRRYREVQFLYGWSYDRTVVYHRVRDPDDEERLRVETQFAGDVGGGYLEAAWWPSAAVSLRGGVRADMFSDGPPATVSPRMEVRWLLTDRAVLTLAGGRYHQFVRMRQPVGGADSEPVTPQQPVTREDSLEVVLRELPNALAVAGANHLSLALDQELAEGLRLTLEGHYKRFDGLPASATVGRSTSGVDVWVRQTRNGLSGWLGYSLAWAWSDPADSTFRPRQRETGRQLLSVGLDGEYRPLGKLGVRVAFGTGLPFASVEPVQGSDPGGSLAASADRLDFSDEPPLTSDPEPYLRVDAEISRTFTPRLGARRTELTPYLRVINALDGRDGLFYQYDDSRGDVRAIAALPLLPVFGVQWKL